MAFVSCVASTALVPVTALCSMDVFGAWVGVIRWNAVEADARFDVCRAVCHERT